MDPENSQPPLYFAYGSNLKRSRLSGRVPSAHAPQVGRVQGYRLTLDKRGKDGSGKANLIVDPAAEVFGVVYRLEPEHWPRLDACEPGYRRVVVSVACGEDELDAQTYISRDRTDDPVPFAHYKRFLVEGAAEHQMPRAWQEKLAALPARPDPA